MDSDSDHGSGRGRMLEYDHDGPASTNSHCYTATVTTPRSWVNQDMGLSDQDDVQFEPSHQLVSEFCMASTITAATVFGSGKCGGAAALGLTRTRQAPLKSESGLGDREAVLSTSQEAAVQVVATASSSLRVKENQPSESERATAIVTTPSPDLKTEGSSQVIPRPRLLVEASRVTVAATGSARQFHKRTIDSINPSHYADKKNIRQRLSSQSLYCTTPTIKPICREKTGTDWQTVLDIVKYGEEQQRKTPTVIDNN